MTTYGVTPTGFVSKPFTECLAEINALLQSIFGNGIDLSPSEPFGQLAAAMAEREVLLWQLAQAVYSARDPLAAEGAGLVELSSITGTTPITPTPSTVSEVLCGTAGTVVPQGAIISTTFVSGTPGQASGIQFETSASTTLMALTAWSTSLAVTLGEQVTNGGQCYQCTTPGTTSGSPGGPTGMGGNFADGSTVVWAWVGTGTAAGTVLLDSVAFGAISGNAGTVTNIANPVSGWTTAYNLLNASPGQALETDTQLRLRRIAELSANGLATVDAINGKLLKLVNSADQPLLTSATTFENDTDTTDIYGLPPHSVEAIVLYSGAPVAAIDQAVALSILQSKAAGIQTYGSQSQTVNDLSGQPHTINFNYPANKYVWLQITVVPQTNPTALPQYAGDSAVQAALSAAVGNLNVSDTIFLGALEAAAMGVAGVLDVTSLTIALTDTLTPPSGGSYTSASQTLTRNQLPVFAQALVTDSVGP